MGAFTDNGGPPLSQNINERDSMDYSETDVGKLKKAFKKYDGNFDSFSQFTFDLGDEEYVTIKYTLKGIEVSSNDVKISIKSKSLDDAIKKTKKKLKIK